MHVHGLYGGTGSAFAQVVEAGDDEHAFLVAEDEQVNAIVCPEQTGATRACATCALCWGTTRNIAFVEH